MKFLFATGLAFLVTFIAASSQRAFAIDAASRVKAAVEYWRDKGSYTEAEMTVHRPDWERTSSMNVWTKGMKMSLVRFVAPAKDAGNASLTVRDDMWTYSPKVNRVIKIPPSMKAQSWMGSDLSYNDLSKADDIVDQYNHRFIGEETNDGHKVAIVESTPLENAPVVWGKEVLKIRDDNIIVEHDFYDQEGKLVKKLTAREIKPLGGKIYATIMRMEQIEEKDQWTEIHHKQAKFGLDLTDSVFTESNLRNPRGN